MGDLDQGLGALPQVLAVQVGHAELGDHVVHIGAGGHHAGARLQLRRDARDLLVLGRRRQADDGQPALGAAPRRG